MFMDMILNGEMRRTVNHKMTGNGQCFGVKINFADLCLISCSVFFPQFHLFPSCHMVFTVFEYFWIRMSAVR